MDLKELAKSVLFNVKNSVKKATTNPMEQIGGITNKYPIDTNNPIYQKVSQLLPTTRALELVGIAGNKNINPTVADAYARLQNNKVTPQDMMLLRSAGNTSLGNLAMSGITGELTNVDVNSSKAIKAALKSLYDEAKGVSKRVPTQNFNLQTDDFTRAIEDFSQGKRPVSKLPINVNEADGGVLNIVDGNTRMAKALRTGKKFINTIVDEDKYRELADREDVLNQALAKLKANQPRTPQGRYDFSN